MSLPRARVNSCHQVVVGSSARVSRRRVVEDACFRIKITLRLQSFPGISDMRSGMSPERFRSGPELEGS